MSEPGGPAETEKSVPIAAARGGGRRSGRNAIWLMLERVTHLGVAFLVTIVVARELGPADYGRLALGIALLMLLMPISNIASQCLMRDTAAQPQSANMLLSSAEVAAGLVTSAIVAVITVGVAVTVGVTSTEGIVILVIVGSSLLRPLQVVDAWFIMQQSSKKVVLIRVAVVLVTGAIRVALPLAGYGVVAVAWTYVAESALASIGSWIAYRRYNKDYRWELNRGRMFSVVKEFVPLLLVASTALVYQRLDQVMLAWLSDFKETGVFAAASSLADAPKFPLIALALSFTPRLLALKKTDHERYKTALSDFARFVNLCGYAITLGLILVMAPLAPLLLGPAYDDATVVIIILAFSTPLAAVGATLLLLTNWEKLYREAIIRNLVGAAISVGLNFVLIPPLGAVGAAISTCVAMLWVFVIGVWVDRRTRYIFWISLPTLDPISSVKILLARRRERQEERDFFRGSE
ncbi:MAG: flippase [Actinomycetota bacterium]|nr:flippase [Actinomycetota bacterium]